MTELSDDLLVAYVDGQLARKQTRAVEQVLDQDDVLAARVDALKHAHARLEAAFEAILAGEEAEVSAITVPEVDGLVVSWRALKITLAALGIASAAALAIAGYGWPLSLPGVGLTPQAPPPPAQTESVASVAGDWQEEATRAHALLSRETVQIGLESQANVDFVSLQLARMLGADAKLPNLEAQGFLFKRVQALRFGDEPLAQILYLGLKGDPIALYAKKGDGDASETLLPGRFGDVNTVSWSEDGMSYLLAGAHDGALLMRIATRIKLEPVPSARGAPKAQTPVNGALDTP
jgi:anti-sigma factor RsiW